MLFWGVAILRLLLPVSLPFITDVIVLPAEVNPILNYAGNALPEMQIGSLSENTMDILSVETDAVSPTITLGTVFMAVWIIGILLCLGYFIISYLRCLKEFKTSLPLTNSHIEKTLEEHPLHRRRIEVRTLSGISTPLTYGLFHPVILIPKSLEKENHRQLDYVILHEYTHIRRFDILRKLIVTLVTCIYWFNPAVWILYILYNRDIELVCDENVVKSFSGDNRAAYARTLIDLEEQRCSLTPFYTNFAKNAIEERIKFIMKSRRKSILVLILSLAFIIIGATTAFAAGSGYKPLPLSSHSGQHAEVQHQSSHKTNTSFISSQGCNDINCTDTTHYHSCSPACENPAHDHNHESEHVSSGHTNHTNSTTSGFTQTSHHSTSKHSDSKHR